MISLCSGSCCAFRSSRGTAIATPSRFDRSVRGRHGSPAQQTQIGLHHFLDQFRKRAARRPPETLPGLGGVAQQGFHLGRPEQILVDYHVITVIEADMTKRGVGEFADRVLADRKFKRPFGAAPPAARPRRPARPRSPRRPRRTPGSCAPPSPAGAACSPAARGGTVWTGPAGGGADFKGDSTTALT